MTRADHPSGTDRVAEVAEQFLEAQIIVNLQGDEPEISGEALDRVVHLLQADAKLPMATLATPILDPAILDDPACVKVVFDLHGRALYFSRCPIPHHRDGRPQPQPGQPILGHLHLGLYAYRRDFLLSLAQLPPSRLEQTEKLEQLRVLEAGHPIGVGVVSERTIGIDTPDEYRAFVERFRSCGTGGGDGGRVPP